MLHCLGWADTIEVGGSRITGPFAMKGLPELLVGTNWCRSIEQVPPTAFKNVKYGDSSNLSKTPQILSTVREGGKGRGGEERGGKAKQSQAGKSV